MPSMKISVDEVDFIIKIKKLKYSNCEIARKLGVTEGTIRYRITRQLSGKGDGRKGKASELDRYVSVLTQWAEYYSGGYHRPAMKTIYERLERDYGYKGSYDAFRRYLGKHFPEFHRKVVRMRIETPPGAIAFVDWKEDIQLQMGWYGNWVKLQALSNLHLFYLNQPQNPIKHFLHFFFELFIFLHYLHYSWTQD